MTGGTHREGEQVLLARARAGDEDAFGVLVAPYLRELHAHCYRMLGSVHDAEDVRQEVLMRAWRYLGDFGGRGSVRRWLYRIATNRCLTARSRAAASPAPALSPAPPPPNAPDVEVTELEPYPDAWLRELAGPGDPAAGYEVRESVQLAFLTVIQLLPPRQRGWPSWPACGTTPVTRGAATSTCGSGRSPSAARAARTGSSRSATRPPGAWTGTCAPAPGTRRPGGPSCGSGPTAGSR